MQWYGGDIAEAVAMSKSKNAIFVVYIEGEDENSTNLTSLINDSEITAKLESSTFVAIKIEAESISYRHFSAIYNTVPIPSIFFIGKNGKPLDIIDASTDASDLSTRINSIIAAHDGVSATSSKRITTAKQSEDLIKSEQNAQIAPETKPEPEIKQEISKTPEVASDEVKQSEGADTVETPKTNEDQTIENEKSTEEQKVELSKDEKVQRAKELVEIKREIKKKEEEEAERQRELERRKTGQDVQKLRRWQQDQELKNLMEERQRAKIEEKAARDRILAQIAQDKADRAAKFGTSPPAHQNTEVTPRPSVNTTANSNITRLQFRLPDGSSKTHEFNSSATLQEVRNYVMENLNLPFRNFNLSTTFPRREFTNEDLEETLRDLQLCPNAVVLVLPAASASAIISPQGGGFVSLIWFLLSPILSFFGYFRTLIFGQSDTEAHKPPERIKRNNDIHDQQQQSVKRKATESTVVRRQGNIHRLSDRSDNDDDNNTWNGNSTQQM